jgi:two-component system response regulator FixJ
MMSNNRGSVAIVDDDPAVLDALRFLLEIAGHNVDTYGSAAAVLGDRALQPACLILDYHMPRMTGLELATQLRAERMVAPILLISGALSPAIIVQAARIGVDKVLGKPPPEDELLSLVNAHR